MAPGITVTVFERADRIGGLLMYGIPNMKLEKWIVERRVQVMADEGVTFVTGTEIGKDIPGAQLLDQFDAIVLATGATRPRDLPIPGRELKGIHFAMEFLHANTKSLLDSGLENGAYINAKDKRVIVIGGGDTGTDCIGTSLRHGCKASSTSRSCRCLREACAANNPWPQWPRVFRVDYGHAEAAAKFGRDPREFEISTVEFQGDDQGRVKALKSVRVDWSKPVKGGPPFTLVDGSEEIFECDLVFLAMGFLGPETAGFPAARASNWIRGRTIRPTTENTGRTSTRCSPRETAAAGRASIVWAINEGRGAARECDRYLMGSTELPMRK